MASQIRLGQDGPNFRLVELFDLECRLAGHLDALVMGREAGVDLALETLAVAVEYGEVFTAFHLCLHARPDSSLASIAPPEVLSWDQVAALGAAAAWCAPELMAKRMRDWIGGPDPMATWIALDVCGLRRVDPKGHLKPLLSHRDARVAGRAMQLAAELGRADLTPDLVQMAETPDPTLRFWAAWSAALLGDRRAAPAILGALVTPATPARQARMVAELLPLILDDRATRAAIARLMADRHTERWGIVATGAFGATDTLDWLLRQMDEPLLSRVAGAAFCRITGARLSADSLELAEFPDDPEDPVVAACPLESFMEAKLYWPDPEKLIHWLAPHRRSLATGTRHILGLPAWTIQPPIETTATYQMDQRAVALELATRAPDAPLPNWRGAVVLQPRGFARKW
ncbi:HEAT repeat domain-containing protein [Tabrizicola sp.]|uniref:HEAT repeat domain-containing protein n=1 Tax=Tabrizicola sp. TaxID=2005166 RepID=UPI00273476C2|nr:HEAT repeat domain-containing protein [Tabrizicola sp.]MDP3195608.1 HEAT repeat domain-containing protein [Tabrizicola sp.]